MRTTSGVVQPFYKHTYNLTPNLTPKTADQKTNQTKR